jgi:two-component system OmpR family sensor kinase
MQAVRNVVRNAVQATGDACKVTVAVDGHATGCVIDVRDEGPGMSREMAERVFDRLYSGTQGVGVGLSIARSIVEQHGGTIEVESELGAGTTFRLWLPEMPSQAGDGARPSARTPQRSG